jgi:hypothetical protein
MEERQELAAVIRREEEEHLEVFLDYWFSREAQTQIEQMVRVLDKTQRGGSALVDRSKGVEE